jgi:hypothetical protein
MAPMSTIARLRDVAALALGGALLLGSPARADQTVYFDDAGDAPHISLIGDSTLTGVRWYDDYGALARFNFVFSAESCRRTVEQSCISREGYRSENVITAMRRLDGELGEVLVVMSGYNDPAWSIDEAVDGVVAEAREQGVPRVVWLTLRTNGVNYSDPQEQTSTETFRVYNERLVAAAAASDGFLQVADWATHSNGASGWFEADGVHLTARGVDALTTYVADIVERVLAGDNVSTAAAPWTVLVPGADGDTVVAVQEAVLAAGIELPGGADGMYGDSTMAAVAEYQRQAGTLQVTGAVDEATARALGVLAEPEAEPSTAASTTAPNTAATTAVAEVAGAASASAPEREPVVSARAGDASGSGRARWMLIGAVVGLALLAGLAGRRRLVIARRAERRWARVHPATSPLRSVADMRRAGALYDHQLERPAHHEEPAAP